MSGNSFVSISVVALVFSMMWPLAAMGDNESIVFLNECQGCHVSPAGNANGMGPPLGGLSEQYILRQLEGFKYGWRSAGHPEAKIMSQPISNYSDRELKNIACWASNTGIEKIFDYSLGQASSGYKLYKEKCEGCHDSVIGRYITGSPKLKNMDADYIIRRLHLIDKKIHWFEKPSKHQLKMQEVVQSLTDDEFGVLIQFIDSASLDNGENSYDE